VELLSDPILPALALLAVLLLALIVIGGMILRRVNPREVFELPARLDGLERSLDRVERSVRDEVVRSREDIVGGGDRLRTELTTTLTQTGEALSRRHMDLTALQQTQWEGVHGRLRDLADSNERKFDALRETVDTQLKTLQADNTTKLEEMRRTVDEKLQATLEERLGASFRQVSERLEQVHRGLGEMQALATGVGDLKRVLSNVKSRGTWGEVHLASLLEQVLAPEQYAANVATREGSSDRVEFAVRLPGPEGRDGDVVWLPIDAKFPLEDYVRLTEAADRGDSAVVDQAARELEVRVRQFGRDIRNKYLEPPRTTDFAIMFLPTEGLYAEILRRPAIVEFLQRECRVVVAGPTTLWAMLSSLRMGFRTLAIQKRSSEVWSVLGHVRDDFSRFGGTLEAVQKKLEEASKKVDEARKGSRRIERRLQGVQELPAADGVPEGDTTPRPPGTPLLDAVEEEV
jgi:DNA recombination protein RmuC